MNSCVPTSQLKKENIAGTRLLLSDCFSFLLLLGGDPPILNLMLKSRSLSPHWVVETGIAISVSETCFISFLF